MVYILNRRGNKKYRSSPILVSLQQDGKSAILVKEIKVKLRNGYRIIVPAGFKTDFASVPRIFWSVISPIGKGYTSAAIVHDYLYSTHQVTKKEADNIFLWLMQRDGVSYLKRYAMYWSVRLFGGKAWKK